MANKEHRWDFSDIIISGKDGANVVVKHKHPESDIESCNEIIKQIYKECTEYAHDGQQIESSNGPAGQLVVRDFAFAYKDYELKQLVRFRVNVQPTTQGNHFCLRRINGNIPSLASQGYPEKLREALMHPKRRGLVLFAGEMGMGKTSAAAATIAEWLSLNGGTAITLEDPPEYKLQGPHQFPGQKGGYCMQRHIQTQKMAEEIPSLMRAGAPEIIFLGEIRSADVAREVMLAASNGHLVFSTIHGKGIEGALNRLLSLASTGAIDFEAAAKIVGSSLSMVICQELKRRRKENGFEKILRVSWIDLMDESKRTALSSNISKNQIDNVKQLIGNPVENRSEL